MKANRSNRIKDSVPNRIFQICNYALLTLVIGITLYPFWHAMMVSISSPSRYMRHSGLLPLPLGFDFSSYKAVLSNPNMGYG
ncbi:MAG TPA: carbohydrate ABC transporter permease, partial [Clostridia bacterium]|nr:carbohydrate ABC transporter permease [Clostridia bacterium]